MFKKIVSFVMCFVACFSLFACGEQPSSPEVSLSLSKATTTLVIGNTDTITATVNNSSDPVMWFSSDTGVANVAYSGNGRTATVTGAGEGSATITAMVGGKFAYCAVTVTKPALTITLNKQTMSLAVGASEALVATTNPQKAVTWSSQNPAIATVNATTGLVTGVSSGTTKIIASAENKEALCTVTVIAPDITITLNKTSETLKKNSTLTLTANVTGTTQNVTWTSTNSAVAGVIPVNGLNQCTVQALSDGNATIIASVGGKTASCFITVSTPAPIINVDSDNLRLDYGANVKINATFENAEGYTPSYTSSSPSKVSVDQEGNIRAIKNGSATITITVGETVKTISVYVKTPSIEFDLSSKKLNVGDTFNLADNMSVTGFAGTPTYSSSKTDCLTVSSAGVLRAIAVRTAGRNESVTITVTAGSAEEEFYVTILAPAPELTVSTASLAVGVSESANIVYSTKNTTSSNVVTFVSSNTSVATVDSTGRITGVAEGTATITVALTGTTITKTVNVNVSSSVLALSDQHIEVFVGQNKTITASTSEAVTWNSSNGLIATVSNGVVTGVKSGTATITATAGGKTGSCTVTVKANFMITDEDMSINIGEGYQLDTLNAEGTVSWTSSDEDIVEVDSEGYIYGWAAGTATITAQCGGQTSSIEVTVVAPMTINKTTLTIDVQQEATLTVSNAPDIINWYSSNPLVATVSAAGVVKGIKAGTATITVSSGGQTLTCIVTVNALMSIDQATATMDIGHSISLTVSNAPSGVSWASSDATVATVDANGNLGQIGIVTALKAGQTTITATSGTKSVTCVITVNAQMTISQDTLSLLIDQEHTLTVSNAPSTITWSSTNESVATVLNGKVRALSQGATEIQAQSGNQTVTCVVTVRANLTISQGIATVEEDDHITITVSNAKGAINWTVDDATVVSLAQNGASCEITGLKAGQATVTATDTGSGETASCVVTVTAKGEEPQPEIPTGDDTKIQIYVHNFDGGYGSAWLAQLKARFEAAMANYTDSNYPGKRGIEVLITAQKTGIMNLKETIATNIYDVYFNEYAQYYALVQDECIREITDAVTEQIGYNGETKKIQDKLTAEQQQYFGMKQLDGSTKFFGIPHYAGYAGLQYDVALFDEKGFYFIDGYDFDAYKSGDIDLDELFVYDSYSDTKSPGPDGLYDTDDDGLPTTYDEFYALCEYIHGWGIQPVDWTGHDKSAYTTFLLVALATDYEGLDQMMLNYTNNGVATNLARFENGQLVMDATPTTITESNGYELARQAGKYYALGFLRNIILNDNYHGKKCMNSSYSHMDCQTNFVMARADSGYQRTAIIVEGNWWENEATDSFNNMVQRYGSAYSKMNSNYAMMPLPLPTKEAAEARANGETQRTLYDQINSICCVKHDLDSKKWDAVKQFIKFAHTDAELIEYSINTNTLKAFEYNIPADKLAQMTKYGQSIYKAKNSSVIAVPNSTNTLFTNNAGEFQYTLTYRTTIGGVDYTYPLNVFDEKATATGEYFNGMYTFWQTLWQKKGWGQS